VGKKSGRPLPTRAHSRVERRPIAAGTKEAQGTTSLGASGRLGLVAPLELGVRIEPD
jgi:hypothetical protein